MLQAPGCRDRSIDSGLCVHEVLSAENEGAAGATRTCDGVGTIDGDFADAIAGLTGLSFLTEDWTSCATADLTPDASRASCSRTGVSRWR
jgi:hypothetical protein